MGGRVGERARPRDARLAGLQVLGRGPRGRAVHRPPQGRARRNPVGLRLQPGAGHEAGALPRRPGRIAGQGPGGRCGAARHGARFRGDRTASRGRHPAPRVRAGGGGGRRASRRVRVAAGARLARPRRRQGRLRPAALASAPRGLRIPPRQRVGGRERGHPLRSLRRGRRHPDERALPVHHARGAARRRRRSATPGSPCTRTGARTSRPRRSGRSFPGSRLR